MKGTSCLVKTWPQKPRDLLDQSIGSQKGIVLLSKLLNLLLILIQLLKVICRHALDAKGIGLVTMLLISQEANFELLTRDMLQLDSSGETLVLLGVVVLKTDLEVHGLCELPFFVLGMLQDIAYALVQSFLRNFTHGG